MYKYHCHDNNSILQYTLIYVHLKIKFGCYFTVCLYIVQCRVRWNVFFVAKFNRVICDVALFPEENMFPNFFTFGPLRCHFKNHLFKNSQKSSFNNISPNFENHNISVLEDDLLNTNLEKIASFIYFPDLQKCLSTFKKEFGIAHLYTHYHTYDQVLGLKWSHKMYILVLSSLILPKLKFLFYDFTLFANIKTIRIF